MVANAVHFGLPSTGYLHLGNGYTAEYVQVGRGEPLVLVPGLAGGISLLEPLIRDLSQNFQVTAYQLRGEDQGLFERNFGFDQLVTDLDQVITTLGLERPGLLGVSFGAAIALDYATRFSPKLSFLAVQGAAMNFDPGLFGNVAREVLNRLPLPCDSPFLNQFFSILIGNRCREGEQFDFVVNRCWRTDQSVMAHRFALLDEYNVTSKICSLSVPTLVLGCEQDFVVPPAQVENLAGEIREARFQRLPSAGHFAFVTHAREIACQVQGFQKDLQTT